MIPHSQPWITESELDAVAEVTRSAMLSSGARGTALEQSLSDLLHKDTTILTGSGSQALFLILKTLEIGPGSEVILPTYVCDKVYHTVRMSGAIPVLCDIGPHWVMTPETVAPLITNHTKAIILVHTFGIKAQTEAFIQLGVPVIEDICQSLGGWSPANFSGQATQWAFGSFHGTKCISGGEGGFASFAFHAQGSRARNLLPQLPLVGRMSDVQSALVLAQLKRYSDFLNQRRKISSRYLRDLPSAWLSPAQNIAGASMFFRFPVHIHSSFTHIQQQYAIQGIAVRRGVDALIHHELGISDSLFPNAAYALENTVSLPILPQLSDEQVQHIIDISHQIYSGL
ncbi:MAG: DegT/DnrJ/EryC1/StrS family aminotransferase [Bacteroidetes bacterium]|nr:DegT/DnrJ/EryC1/StrS family aminotransferase [Bacteroidota bacterium]